MTDADAPPILFPDNMDDLLFDRCTSQLLSSIALLKQANRLSDLYERWADRLSARIAEAAQ